jgi:hypothetical protein
MAAPERSFWRSSGGQAGNQAADHRRLGSTGQEPSAEDRRPVNRWAPTTRRDIYGRGGRQALAVSARQMVTRYRRIAA